MTSENGSHNGRRVVVTGLGAVSPLGLDVETTWSNLLAGECGAGPITHFDHTDYKVHFACEVKGLDPTGLAAVGGVIGPACAATGTYNQATMNKDLLETVGPCDQVSGQSVF